MRKKLCIVIQRYGNEIVGGAETYCRIYAERLSALYDVEVLTTCALDYQEWKNSYPEGETTVNGVTVRRFRVDVQRDCKKFAVLSQNIYNNPVHTTEECVKWVEQQGPVSSGMIEYIKENRDNYDLFIFMTYLYYHTVAGMPQVRDKAVLVPFAHDEPSVYLKIYRDIFTMPRGIIYNTEEERNFIQTRFDNKSIPSVLTGIGIDIPCEKKYNRCSDRFSLNFPYIVYMGRIDKSKGCHELVEYFRYFRKAYKSNIKLVMTGKALMNIPKDRNIICLGFVTEEEKFDILSKSIAFVLPSHYESLSIVVLEAFAVKKPVLVSAHCDVLKGHCIKSNGGLYFSSREYFCECLKLLADNGELCRALGKNGFDYVLERYQWGTIMDKLTGFLNEIDNGGRNNERT